MLFYEAQRSGRLPSTNRIAWRGNSALADCTAVGCTTDSNGDGNLAGGYYDAGDHVKFGFPMAWSMTVLSWGAIQYADAIKNCSQWQYYLDNIKWGTDYFIKAHTDATTFWGQVGNGGIDHAFWGPAEAMTMSRPSYDINANSGGTELAMETAAALAAAYIIFSNEPGYSDYAATLLSHSRQLYDFGNTVRASYVNAITDAAAYYNSWSGYNDEIVWASAWLARATGEQTYLDAAVTGYTQYSIASNCLQNSFDWDLKSAGAIVLLYQITGQASYLTDAQNWLSWWLPNGGISYTPGGLAWIRQWGSLRYAANAAALALQIGGDAAIQFATAQIDYALGTNPRGGSYVVGYGTNPPEFCHHAGASGYPDINDPRPNLYVLYGALVGGPGVADDWADLRNDYVKNEVACDYNAGFTLALAALLARNGGSSGPITPPATGGSGGTTSSSSGAPSTTDSSSSASSGTSTGGSTSTTGTPSTSSGTSSTSDNSGSGVPAGALSVYTDSLQNGFQDWSWAAHSLAATPARSGTSISFVAQAYQAVYLHCNECMDLGSYEGVEFWINGGSSGGQHINIAAIKNTALIGYGVDVASLIGSPIPANQWTMVRVSFTALGAAAGDTLDGIWWQDMSSNNEGTVYLDDISIYPIGSK